MRPAHVLHSTKPAGYDEHVCREYQGRELGYCGKRGTFGLCVVHATDRARHERKPDR